MLYTRKGDSGISGLFGTKERFPKNSPIYDALGTLDELNSLLGLCSAKSASNPLREANISAALRTSQQNIFIAQAELAGVQKHIPQARVLELESMTDRLEMQMGHRGTFIIPGATELSALLDYARAVCRRAERSVLAAHAAREVSPSTKNYLNRLSSFLYALARYSAHAADVEESSPQYQ